LRAAGQAGRRPRLSAAELDAVDQALRKGPEAFGFDTELWTLARVAQVIERLTGVRHHPGQVWRILRRLGWSLQRPARRAAERDEVEVARWRVQEWPRIKGGAEARRVAVLPGRARRVAAPTGAAHLGAARGDPDPAAPGPLEAGVDGGICCYRPDGSRARLCFHSQPDSYNSQTLIGVLRGLRRFLRGAPVTLVWDNLPAHHSRLMGAWLEGQRHWLQVEYLPGYATTWTRWRDCGPTSRTWSWPT
jgi:hypothetical protein